MNTLTNARLNKLASWRKTHGDSTDVTLPALEIEELASRVIAAESVPSTIYVQGLLMNLTYLKYYDELTPAAQAEARRNVAASVQTHHGREIGKAFFKFQRDPNKAINDPLHIRRIINGGEAWRKIRQEGDAYLIRFIRPNKLIFTDCGAYVAYVDAFTMFIDGLEYIPTASQQKALRTPYIDVNGRGPDFHD